MSDDESDEELQLINSSRSNSARIFKERVNYLENLNETIFLNSFRMSKECFNQLLEKIWDKLTPNSARLASVIDNLYK